MRTEYAQISSVKAIIFDCDGVMFDSKDANDAYYNHILMHFGKPAMSKKESAYVHMNTARASLAYLFRKDDRAEEAEAYRQQLSYLPFISDMKMEPYLVEFLAFLKPLYKTAVATNRSDTMDRVLEEHGLTDRFDRVVTSLDVTRPKPDPECLFDILAHFELQPDEAFYIGDSEIDEKTAKAAQVRFVAYKNPALVADIHISSFAQMQALLEQKHRPKG